MRRARARVLATVVAGTMAVTGLAGLAVVAKGIPVRSIEGMDSGVWVTKDRDGIFGRQNKTARTLDAGFYASSTIRDSSLDIAQDGATVVAYDRDRSTLYAVDTTLGRPVEGAKVTVAPGSVLDLRGGTIAVLDPATGEIRATRYSHDEPIPTLSDVDGETSEVLATITAAPKSDKPLAETSDLVVTDQGAVVAVDHTGKRVRIPIAEDGSFGKPQTSTTGKHAQVRLGAVGDHVVLVDPQAGTVQIDDGAPARIGGDDPLPQTPGPDRPVAVVSTTSSLVSVPLGGGAPRVVFDGARGRSGAPLVVGDCSYAAWAGSPGTVAQACGDQPHAALGMPRGKTLSKPVFRSNRGYVVLNDVDSGQIYDPGTEQVMDDWINILRPVDPRKNEKDSRQVNSKEKPRATPDNQERARVGRTTVLHPTDNDSDPAGGVLSIVKVDPARTDNWSVTISPDGQTLAFTLVKDTKRTPRFTYEIDNGRGGTARSTVTVPKAGKGSRPPRAVEGFGLPARVTMAGGRIVIPITPDWRDDDGDPISLRKVRAGKGGVASITPDGTSVDFGADPDASGPVRVDFDVADDRGRSTKGSVIVQVQDAAAETPVQPVAKPDVVRGVIGVPVVCTPAANDVAGLDPAEPEATLAIYGEVVPADKDQAKQLQVTTDQGTGRVTVVASKAGSYLLDYSVATGSATRADGKIRVDIEDKSPETPVAMPDTVVVHGQSPASLDVIANDADPGGRVLTVTAVDVGQAPVQAVVMGGRWIRFTPTGAGKRTSGSVRYTVTNGIKTTTAEVSVVLLDPVVPDPPVTSPDEATVRAGDAIRLPVLEDDTTAGGAPLSLLPNVEGAPEVGQLTVTDAKDQDEKKVGAAYVSGSDILYVAPDSVTQQRSVVIDYVAQTPSGERAGGQATVSITPAPTEEHANLPPDPDSVEARTAAGETITIPIPSSGQDPDGDSTIVTGLASAPKLGRVLGFSPNSITYQAYPEGSTGTDTFLVTVADRFGGSGTARVRVAVAAPGEPQLALPVADSIVAAPDAQVTVVPSENDLVARGDPVTVRPLPQTNKRLAKGVSLSRDGKVVTARAPGKDGDPLTINYGLTGLGGNSTVSTVTVRSLEDYQNPPRVYDVMAKPGSGATASVDLLARAYDPDGDSAKLTVDIQGGSGVKVSGGKATVPLTAAAQAIPFTVTDESGARSAAVIYAPPAGAGGPHFRSEAGPIVVQPGAETTVALADYVASPSGKAVRLANSRHNLAASPAQTVTKAEPTKKLDRITVFGGKRAGPGAVVAEVVEDDDKTSTWVSIPVQVGDPGPLMRCPTNALSVPQGGVPLRLPITTLCHVWLGDPAALRAQKYEARWEGAGLDGVQIGGNGTDTITLSASGAASTGTAELKVTASGTSSSAILRISAEAAPPATLSAIARDRVRAGEAVTIDVSDYLSSPLKAPVVEVTELSVVSGSAGHTFSGSRITLTPAGDATGQIVFAVAAKDAPDATAERWARSTVTLDVFGKPDPPSDVVPVDAPINGAVTLEWNPGAANGSPIDYYEVEGAGTKRCAASPCTITGLDTGTETTFRVRAHNEAGFSEWSSPSPPITVDVKPGAPADVRVTDVGDGYVNLAWSPAPSEGSPVTGYAISWAGGRFSVGGTSTTARASGLDNNLSYDFCVAADNEAGTGPKACTSGQSAGTPDAPTISASDDGAGTVTVSWSEVLPNGPGPVTYALTVDGAPIYSGTGTSVRDTATLGTTYTYTVQATNAAGNSSSASIPHTVVGTPDPWTPPLVIRPGDQLVTMDPIAIPRPNGAWGEVKATIGGVTKVVATVEADGGKLSQQDFTGLTNGQPYSVTLELCNEAGRCATTTSNSETPFGTITQIPTIEYEVSGTQVTFWATGAGNGLSATLSVTGPGGSTGSCTTTIDPCTTEHVTADVGGYGLPFTLTAKVADENSERSSEKSGVTDAEPRNPSVSLDGEPSEQCEASENCHAMSFTPTDFAEGVSCSVTDAGAISYSVAGDYSGTNGNPTPVGIFDGTSVDVWCTDTQGNSASDSWSISGRSNRGDQR